MRVSESAGATGSGPDVALQVPPVIKLRMILNTYYSGPQAWFFLADDLGYLREEGLEIEFVEGDTAANAVPRIASGEFDIGYGDTNALIELAGQQPADAPIATFVMHNWSPYTIAVPADGPLTTPRLLEGRNLVAHPNDAALRMLPEFGWKVGIDASRINIEISSLHHRDMIREMLEKSRWDGIFGFVNTLGSAAIEAGFDPQRTLRHFEYRHYIPELYGAALMVAKDVAKDSPKAIEGLVRAINRGVAAAAGDLDAAIDAVARRNPHIDRVANRARLAGTLRIEMSHPEGCRSGIGDVDDERLQGAIALIAKAKGLPHLPSPDAVFTRRFLPPLNERVRSLAMPS